MAYHWTRILLRLPASGADKAAVLAECAKLPPDFGTLHDVCAAMAASPMDYNQSHKVLTDELPSVAHHNLMFASDGKRWSDTTDRGRPATAAGAGTPSSPTSTTTGGKTCSSSRAPGSALHPSNVLYRNRGGERLEEVTRTAGLEDHLPTAASLFPTWMRTVTSTSSPSRSSSPRALAEREACRARLRGAARRPAHRQSLRGGCRVEIRSADGRLQVREVKASGGHQSHDLLVARFGLGDWKGVSAIQVTWPDGESTELRADGLGPGRYRLVRRAN